MPTKVQAGDITKHDVKLIISQWKEINDDLTINWNSLDTNGKVNALKAQALFSQKATKYLLSKEFEEITT